MIGLVTLALGTNDGDFRPRGDQRQRFLPDPPVERQRQVLNDNKDFAARERARVRRRELDASAVSGHCRICHRAWNVHSTVSHLEGQTVARRTVRVDHNVEGAPPPQPLSLLTRRSGSFGR